MNARSAGEGRDLAQVLAATFATQSLATWSVLALAAVAPTIAQDFGVPAVLIGYQITIVYLAAMVTSLFASAMVARWGGCRASQLCLLACALGCITAALPHLLAIALASVVIGWAYGLTNPSSAHLLASRTQAGNRSFVFSVKQTGVPIGGIIAGLVMPSLATRVGWQTAVALTAVPALLVAWSMQPARRRWDADCDAAPPMVGGALQRARNVLARPDLARLSFCGFCFGAIQLCIMTFVVSLAVIDLAFDPLLAGALLAAVQCGGIAGRLGWGYVADKFQRNDLVLILIGLITVVCCLLVSVLSGDVTRWLIFVLMIVLGASAIGWNGVFVSEAVRLSPPAMAGSVVGVTTFCTFAGVLAGPTLFVHLYGALESYVAVFGALSVLALIGVLAILTRFFGHVDSSKA